MTRRLAVLAVACLALTGCMTVTPQQPPAPVPRPVSVTRTPAEAAGRLPMEGPVRAGLVSLSPTENRHGSHKKRKTRKVRGRPGTARAAPPGYGARPPTRRPAAPAPRAKAPVRRPAPVPAKPRHRAPAPVPRVPVQGGGVSGHMVCKWAAGAGVASGTVRACRKQMG
ncbi:hypothetical protein [Streptomyces sp. NPDC001054]